ncbi:MAG: Gfo/Idh/MocA family oxidoreductase [Acidobacteria bacterium]|nr:Gfo/Idh/MocA family oxidoreductase [Acidobacteriota bacterium]
MERRYFLLGSATLASKALKAMPSANDTIRVAVAGIRGQGGAHIGQYSRMQNVEIAALCDIDESVLDRRLKDLDKAGKKKPQTFTDFRKLLEAKDIDAVSIATPNHNHTLQAIWAMQAGKHVYVEKPCAHNMFESRQIVAAARKYNKLVQHGANSRSGVAVKEAIQHMRDGLIGDVYMARGLCFKWRDTIGRKPVEAVPAGVAYDLWLGPAPKREFTQNRFHYNWHWFWDYGNGDLGNQGIHEVDICRWGLGVTYPAKVSAIGGHFMFDDDQETPNTLTATYEFNGGGKKKMMVFEVRHWMSHHEAGIGEKGTFGGGNTVGNIFYGSKGYLAIDGYDRYKTFLGRKAEPGPERIAPGNNWQNFIDALRSGRREDLNAEIEDGAISCTLVHLANISYRLGRTLHFDASSYSVAGDKEANAMFTRSYREGFVVPKKV